MATQELRRVEGSRPWARDVNPLYDGVMGIYGTRVRFIGYDGGSKAISGGAALGSGLYTLVTQSAIGLHEAALHSGTPNGATVAPTPANAVKLVTDDYVAVGMGKQLRMYGPAGTGYGQFTSDNNGVVTLGGAGAGVGSFVGASVTLSGYLAIGVTPATAGAIRLTNATNVSTRTVSNTADMNLIMADILNDVRVSDATNAALTYLQAANGIRLRIGAADVLTLDATTLTLTPSAARISGDMTNATIINRLSLQSNVVNGFTYPNVLPNGTSQISGMAFYNGSNPAAASYIDFLITNVEGRIYSGHNGAAYLPLAFYTNGAATATMRLDIANNVGIGAVAPAGSRLYTSGGLMEAASGTKNRQHEIQIGWLTPAAIGANTDNYNPAGLNTARILRLDPSGAYTLSGIVAQVDGFTLTLLNINATNTLTLSHDATSTAANRFRFANLTNVQLTPFGGIEIVYDAGMARWVATRT